MVIKMEDIRIVVEKITVNSTEKIIKIIEIIEAPEECVFRSDGLCTSFISNMIKRNLEEGNEITIQRKL